METVQGKRIDELQGIKNYPKRFYSKNDFVDWMGERGFIKLGQGHYGAVFDHEKFGGRYVLKVFSDPAYEHFIEFCLKTQSPHLPRFVGKVMKVSQNARMVRMERLVPMTEQQYDSAYYNLDTLCYLADLIAFEPEENYEEDPKWAREMNSPYRPMLDLLVAVLKHADNTMTMDFSSDNFMLRGKTAVLTDPYMDHESFKW
jgi:hypothetical protein